jgi:hypothetical protein
MRGKEAAGRSRPRAGRGIGARVQGVAVRGRLTGDVLGLDARQAQPSPLLLRHVAICGAVVDDARHRRVIALGRTSLVVVLAGEASHAGPSTGTASGTLAVPGQGVATREFAIALGTDVRLLAGMQLAVALQVVEPTESQLARLTDVRLLLAVG